MTKCEVCNKGKASAWYKGKEICQHCWIVYKYGDMESYMRRMREHKLKMNKIKIKRMMKGGNKE